MLFIAQTRNKCDCSDVAGAQGELLEGATFVYINALGISDQVMNGEMERGAVGTTRVTFYAFLLLYVGFLIGLVCLSSIMVAAKATNQTRYRTEKGNK